MEDGSSMPLWGLFVLLLLLWLNGIFYGFAAALRNISENDTQKKAEEGDKKAQMLMAPVSYTHLDVYKRQGYDLQDL